MLAHEQCRLLYLAFGTGPLLHPLHRGDSSQELSVCPQLMQLLLIAREFTGGVGVVGARTHSTRKQVIKYICRGRYTSIYTCLSLILLTRLQLPAHATTPNKHVIRKCVLQHTLVVTTRCRLGWALSTPTSTPTQCMYVRMYTAGKQGCGMLVN